MCVSVPEYSPNCVYYISFLMAGSGAVCWLLLQQLFPLSLLDFFLYFPLHFFSLVVHSNLLRSQLTALSIRHTDITFFHNLYIFIYIIFVALGHFVFYGHIRLAISLAPHANQTHLICARIAQQAHHLLMQFGNLLDRQTHTNKHNNRAQHTQHINSLYLCVCVQPLFGCVCASFSKWKFLVSLFSSCIFKQLKNHLFLFFGGRVVNCRRANVLIISYAR